MGLLLSFLDPLGPEDSANAQLLMLFLPILFKNLILQSILLSDKTRFKRLCTIGSHAYDILEKAELGLENRCQEWVGVGGLTTKGCG